MYTSSPTIYRFKSQNVIPVNFAWFGLFASSFIVLKIYQKSRPSMKIWSTIRTASRSK